MTLSDLGAIGEFLGFIAVAVTLIYFARQLRQNTASTRIAASWSMMEAFNLAHSEIFTQRETAELTLKTLQGGDLDPVEQIQVNSMTLRHVNSLIVTHEAYQAGQLSEAIWQRTVEDAEFLTTSGIRPFLLMNLRLAPQKFVADVFGEEIAREAATAEPPHRTLRGVKARADFPPAQV